ncbi:MAG: endonuclease III [Verrucomicrobia bacterium]|jgi:endonuclease III|nr:endonuclease III [Verrucomicrobiota bacterium]
MPRESIQSKKDRMQLVIQGLKQTYPDAHCELDYKNPLQLLIATILSAQCTDKQVNIVTAGLFKKYRSAEDYANASQEALEADIRRIGLFRSKAKNIRHCCQRLIEEHRGEVPASMDALIQLGGVGRKTANVVLGNAFGIQEGVVVDTHVKRLSERLGFTKSKTPEKVELDLQKLVPSEDWTMFSHWLIWHGRRRCSARNPKCAECEIKALCPSNAS